MAAIGTGFNAGASESALAITGSDNNAIAKDGAIALGMNAKLNTGAEFGNVTGNVTFGDPSLGVTFAQTVKDITSSNATALQTALSSAGTANIPDPTDHGHGESPVQRGR